jgi:gluconate 5-dehydrogenase
MSIEQLFSLADRTALITGSSRGIGRAIAEGFAQAGARVIVNGRDRETVGAAARELSKTGANVSEAVFDVTDRNAIARSIEKIESEIGAIDILVNNAGVNFRMALQDYPADQWDKLMRINVDGVFFTGQAVARHMIPRGRGKIINICSVNSIMSRPTNAVYTTTKGAVMNLTKGMATDWARLGLQVNGIAPGYFDTDMAQALKVDKTFEPWLFSRVPAGRWGKLEELVGAAVFLASDASSYVNGHVLFVDGGMAASV